ASGIHSLPAVHFTANASPSGGNASYGNMMTIADSAALQWGSGDYLIEVVTLYDNVPAAASVSDAATGYGAFYSKQSTGGNPALGVAFLANTPAGDTTAGTTAFSSFVQVIQGVSNPTLGFNDGTARLLGTQRTGGTTLTLRVNGAQTTSATVAAEDVDAPNVVVSLGATGDASTARLDGDIAELIAVKGTISAADLASLESGLMVKYGL
ncbi:MAG TPA: hypothetical protein VIJ22_11025, partial [Polyangiaceae bacterium]